MHKAAKFSLIFFWWILAGGLMLAMNEPILRILLVLSGPTIAAVAVNGALDRVRVRRGESPNMDATTFLVDLANFNRHDWKQLILWSIFGVALAIIGIVAFESPTAA